MKKLKRSLVAAALAVSMVVPVFALSSSTTHKYDSGDYADADGGRIPTTVIRRPAPAAQARG